MASLCPACGYDLTGLRPGRACPECGRRPRRRRRDRPVRFHDLPEPFVRRMRRVVWFAAAAAVGSLAWSIALLFGVIAVDPRLASAIGVGIECLWVLAVLLFTVPLEDPDAIERGLGKRSACRRWCRGLQFARPMAAIIEGLELLAVGGGLQTTLAWTADAMGVAGAVGLLLFAVLLVRWAEWIEDETAASWARGYLWAAAGVVLFGVLAVAAMALLPPLVLVPMLGLALCGLALLLLLPASLLSIGLGLDATLRWKRARTRRDEALREEVRGSHRRRARTSGPAPVDEDEPIPLADPDPDPDPGAAAADAGGDADTDTDDEDSDA